MSGDQLLAALRGAGILDEATALRAARDANAEGAEMGAFLMRENIASDDAITEAKAAVLHVPRYRLAEKLDASLMSFIPQETAQTYMVAPISISDGNLVVGMVNPDDLRAQEALKFLARQHRLNLGVFLISAEDWKRALRMYSPFQDDVDEAVQSMRVKTRGTTSNKQKFVDLENEAAKGDDAPITRLVTGMLKEAIGLGASDVHIEPSEKGLRIRFRVDGELRESRVLPPELIDPVIGVLKGKAEMKLDERRVPQDGRFRSRLLEREIDFRIATFPTPMGEKVAIRILDSSAGLKTFEQLGLTGRNLESVVQALNEPFGMVLVTGPTGSGKTTTLYAALQRVNSEKVNIVSLEDPVEYFVEGVNQSQVRPEIGYDFAAGLRQILRQDPDVIMVGEIRDRETADLAVNAALTGHVVLSTLHTNDAAGVVPRLIDMGVEPFLLPAALNLMVAQRLVGRLCQACKVGEEATPAINAEIDTIMATLPTGVDHPAKPYTVFRAPGCDQCHKRGTIGRVAVYEVIKMSREIENVITSGASAASIRDIARAQGTLSMRQDGVFKALAGEVLLEEVMKETSED